MSSGKQRADDIDVEEDYDEGEQFIDKDDILTEEVVEGDEPMDEDDDGEEDPQEGSSGVVDDNSVQHFTGHNGSVFAVSCHPKEPLAASGGEDDMGYVWDITDGEIIVKLTGHTDSVTCTAWSADGEMIATGGMDGKVRIWRRVGKENFKTWEFLTELDGPDEVIFLRWHPKGNVLLAGSNDSMLWLWQLPKGTTMQVFAGHTGPVNCGDFSPDGKKIVSACADGTLILWDPRQPTPVFRLGAEDARFNLDGITSLAINPSSTLAVVGGAAGGVRVVSLTKGEVTGTLGGHTEGESIEAVAFVDITGSGSGPGVAVTGATDGKACIWDLSTMRLRATLQHEDAITNLLAHPAPKAHLLVSASADKTLKTWDARNGTLIKTHKAHRGPILSSSLGLEGHVIVSGGDDALCAIFTTEVVDEDGIMQ
ncbi:ribosome biogenesis protein Sqt1 [Coprinopsis sp. MPI-PUGE-AT-0042]|nr:ribosome biogenesis protein Sqt1 [Coprinopsis sp. MPI-PUGE-AT-0042]